MLYRDAKASFITAENHLMSDGRDDIILEGTDDVNHDENLFLSIVEKSEADI